MSHDPSLNPVEPRRAAIGRGGFALLALAFAAHAPSLGGGFFWDDQVNLVESDLIHDPRGLFRYWFTTDAPDYWPLSYSLLWIQWRLWNGDPLGFRLTNLAMHAACVLLVWGILRRLRVPGAWLVAAVFAVHPVTVESVDWIFQCKTVLSAMFGFLAVRSFLDWEERSPRGLPLGSAAWLALALLAKSAAVFAPLGALLLVWYRRGTLEGRAWKGAVPLLVVSLALGLVGLWFNRHRSSAGQSILEWSMLERLAAAGQSAWFYVAKALWPFGLSIVYPWRPRLDPWDAWTWLGTWLWLLAFVAAFLSIRGGFLFGQGSPWAGWGRCWFAGMGWYLLQLVPILGFVDIAYMRFSLVADHWQYFALPGLLALALGGAASIARRLASPRWLELGWAALLLGGLMVLSMRHAALSLDEEARWLAAVELHPDSVLAHHNLAAILSRRPESIDDAIAHARRAAELDPRSAEPAFNLGVCLLKAGRFAAAKEALRRAARIDPNHAKAHGNLGVALKNLGDPRAAEREYRHALELAPGLLPVQVNLARLLEEEGRTQEAESLYREVLAIDPALEPARQGLRRLIERRE